MMFAGSISWMTFMDSDPDNTGQKQVSARFKPGESGNPRGRPKGARNRFGELFLDDFIDVWQARGKQAIEQSAMREPTQFVKIAAGILPKEVLVAAFNVNATVDMATMEEAKGFLAAYRYARDRIGAPLEPAEIDLTPEAETAWRTDE